MRKHRRLLFSSFGIAGIGAVFAAVVYAATPPPAQPFESDDWEVRVDHKPATGLTLGKFSVRFEETRLQDVIQHAGGSIQHQGDAGDSIYWLCFTIAEAKLSQRLWIIAHGEMGGRDHRVTAVMGQVTADKATVDCPSLPRALRPVRLSSGLWLGASATAPVTQFRKDPGINGEWRGYLYIGKTPGDCKPDGFDVGNSLEWSVTNGSISAISAGQVTSC